MALKVPPPLILLACIILMSLTLLMPVGQISSMPWLGVLAIAIGSIIGFMGVQAFKKAQTTISPVAPEKSSSLVVVGIYRVSRNPMYVGMALLLIGWAFLLGTIWVWLGVVGFVGYIHYFQILPEEKILATKFGDEYQTYCCQTRRWL